MPKIEIKLQHTQALNTNNNNNVITMIKQAQSLVSDKL